MSLYEQIIDAYPELEGNARIFVSDLIVLDDSDGVGAYIAKWEYSEPIPNGLSVGKPFN
jgi:hypothetical protein